MNFEACIECSLTKLWGSGYNLKGKILKLCLNWILNFSRLIANSTFYWGYFPVIYMSLSRSSVSTEDIHVVILPFFLISPLFNFFGRICQRELHIFSWFFLGMIENSNISRQFFVLFFCLFISGSETKTLVITRSHKK